MCENYINSGFHDQERLAHCWLADLCLVCGGSCPKQRGRVKVTDDALHAVNVSAR